MDHRPVSAMIVAMTTATTSPAADLPLADLAARLQGKLLHDDVARTIYATDASEYQQRPLAWLLAKISTSRI